MIAEQLNNIAELLQKNIQLELKRKRVHRGYYGEPKNGNSAPIASGNLYRNIKVEWKGSLEKNDLELDITMPQYWYYVNYGRQPGKLPPAGPIDRWVITKQGLRDVVRDRSGKLLKRKSLVYLIRRSIGEMGYEATYFLDAAISNTYAEIKENISEGLAEFFIGKLEDFITSKRTI